LIKLCLKVVKLDNFQSIEVVLYILAELTCDSKLAHKLMELVKLLE
jgi:hypothetical protein